MESERDRNLFLDFQSSWEYGSFFPGSKGQRAKENAVLHPIMKRVLESKIMRSEAEDQEQNLSSKWAKSLRCCQPLRKKVTSKNSARACEESFRKWVATKSREKIAREESGEIFEREEMERRKELKLRSAQSVQEWLEMKATKERLSIESKKQRAKDFRMERLERKQETAKALERYEVALQRKCRLENHLTVKEPEGTSREKEGKTFEEWQIEIRERENRAKLREEYLSKLVKYKNIKSRERRWQRRELISSHSGQESIRDSIEQHDREDS